VNNEIRLKMFFGGTVVWHRRQATSGREPTRSTVDQNLNQICLCQTRPSYGDLCVFKMAVGRHLGFSEKWNLKAFLFRGRRFFSLSQILLIWKSPSAKKSTCAIEPQVWPLKWIFKMAAAAILNFVEVKFDVKLSHGWPVSISVPNLAKISWRAAELWRFMCF